MRKPTKEAQDLLDSMYEQWLPCGNGDAMDATPYAGRHVVCDGWSSSIKSNPHSGTWTILRDNDWEKADFRMELPYTGSEIAVNIEVTGKQVRWFHGEPFCRVRVIFVGDCEPDRTSGGWMLLG
jgi:hypothetical protein